MMLTLQDSLFSASLAVYMTASVFVAAVRWGHRCRLAHAARMQVEHPDRPLSAVIEDAGFASRTTYYKVRKQLEE